MLNDGTCGAVTGSPVTLERRQENFRFEQDIRLPERVSGANTEYGR